MMTLTIQQKSNKMSIQKDVDNIFKLSQELLEINKEAGNSIIDEELFMDFFKLTSPEQKQVLTLMKYIDPNKKRDG